MKNLIVVSALALAGCSIVPQAPSDVQMEGIFLA